MTFPSATVYEYVRRAVVNLADEVIARQRVVEANAAPLGYDPCNHERSRRAKALADADHALVMAFIHAIEESRRVC